MSILTGSTKSLLPDVPKPNIVYPRRKYGSSKKYRKELNADLPPEIKAKWRGLSCIQKTTKNSYTCDRCGKVRPSGYYHEVSRWNPTGEKTVYIFCSECAKTRADCLHIVDSDAVYYDVWRYGTLTDFEKTDPEEYDDFLAELIIPRTDNTTKLKMF